MSSLAGKQGPRYRHTAGEEEPYETIAVEKLTPIIGAEISGVDIGKLVSDEARSNRQMDEIHRALAENQVIFFRNQNITPQQHLAFGRKFGELHVHPAAPSEGEDTALERIWVVAPSHPVAAGVPAYFELAREEMYCEPFEVPEPDELVFISWFKGGEVFRSGCAYRRGRARIFYFRPGHETFPTYHDATVQRVIVNAARWAAPASVTAEPFVNLRVDPVEPF